ncbi:MAG: hypothetical protein R2757_03050 [Draconibacterium sp.]
MKSPRSNGGKQYSNKHRNARETIGLDEVVAIGYGVVKRKDLTSFVTKIKSEELNKVISTDIFILLLKAKPLE